MNKLPDVVKGDVALSGRKITVALDPLPFTSAHTKMKHLPDNIKEKLKELRRTNNHLQVP